ncbi:50S ribosomal protein L10 [Iamia sp.]|uniref:50S ribosomal protein L10 n=1 Tax=Iamia sp. TaxID=2722710 RepID=UPI002C8BD2ED|nr:50S ribosomal protein L10 [Iamia sp.]HXH56295.1 50S ribosomal protein L10 [Iamia sp.]
MDNPRADKVAVVTEVGERFDAAEAAVLTEYRGLGVAALAELRAAMRAAGGTYKIYKNTLVRLAAQERGLDIEPMLTGPTAIAFVDGDAAGVAKALRDYARTNPALVVKGGLLGTVVLGPDDIKTLADLPGRDQLLSEIAGLFAAPMQQFASLLDAVPRSFSYALGALVTAGGAPGAPETPTPDAADETTPVEDPAPPAEDPATPSATPADDTTPPADAGNETPAESAETEES